MLTLHDEVMGIFRLSSTEKIDIPSVNQWLTLMISFFQLAIAIMTVVMGIIKTLDEIAVEFWRGWDAFIIGLRWQLCPIPVAPMG